MKIFNNEISSVHSEQEYAVNSVLGKSMQYVAFLGIHLKRRKIVFGQEYWFISTMDIKFFHFYQVLINLRVIHCGREL